MVPPKTGCGWQTSAAIADATAGGVHSTASNLPAGPGKKKFFDSCVELIGGQNSLYESCSLLRLDWLLRFLPYCDAKRFASRFHFDSGYLSFPFSIAAPRRFATGVKGYQQPLPKSVFAIRHKFQFLARDFQRHRVFVPGHILWPYSNRQGYFISSPILIFICCMAAVPPRLTMRSSFEVHGHVPAR